MKRILPVLVVWLAACNPVHSSVVRTGANVAAYHGPVKVLNLSTPAGKQVGIVQVHGPRTIEELLPEFKLKVAELGGDVGVVDSVKSKFEMQTQLQTYTYKCGQATCTGTRPVQVEVMTVQVMGRAFRQ